MRRAWPLIALGAALSSCSDGGGDRAPDLATPDEERALSQAAEMLDERPRGEDVPDTDPTPAD